MKIQTLCKRIISLTLIGILAFSLCGCSRDRKKDQAAYRAYGITCLQDGQYEEAVEAFEYLSRMEGIIPAIESAHAVAYARKLAPTMGKDQIIVVNISGRGDKDCAAIARYRGEDLHE